MSRLRPLRFRYSLRALAIFLTLFCLWGGYHANIAWKERRAEATLVGSRAVVRAYEGFPTIWPYRFIGELELVSSLDSKTVEALCALPFLKVVDIRAAAEGGIVRSGRQPTLPRGALERLFNVSTLHQLRLDGWTLDEGDCADISKCHRLEKLDVLRCDISEHGFALLVATPSLRVARVQYCRVAGVETDKAPPSWTLEEIDCYGTPLVPNFADFIARCPNLKRLLVGGTLSPGRKSTVDDEFVARVAAHPSIETLDLKQTAITDKAFRPSWGCRL